ncbi:MAG: hypothetical protein OXQ29_15180 [Rhodospirillaceae bacterium]|nr:hypothetical protein [Rhodospirillaceae bacterium]
MTRENAKRKRLLAMLAGVALTVTACGGGGGSSMAPSQPQPDPVDLSMVTPGHMVLPAGTIEIVAGMSMDHGDVTFMCAPNGGNCTVMVAADGTVTATGGTVTATDSPAYTMRLAADGQRTAATNAIMAAKTAADALSTMSTDEEIAAAEALIVTARTAVTNATDLSMADLAALNGQIADVETTVSDVRMAIAEGLAEGMRVAMAIGPDSTRADADSSAEGHQLPFTINAGTVTTTIPDTSDDMTDDLMRSASTPAGIGGWTGAIYTRAMGMVTDRVVSYTDFTEPGPAAFSAYYAPGAVDAPDGNVVDTSPATTGDEYVDWPSGAITSVLEDDAGTASVDETGWLVLTAGSAIAADVASQFFSAAMFPPVGDTTTYVATDADMDGTYEYGFAGSFHGVAGRYRCTGGSATACGAAVDSAGALTLTGTWHFVATDAMNAMVAGVMRDVDYLDFGYWLESTTAADATLSHAVLAFARGERDYGGVASVVGRASYAGPATGLYALKRVDPNTAEPTRLWSGQFTADAMLTATFGRGDLAIATNEQFMITGSVSNFRNADGDMINSAWTVDLGVDAANDEDTGIAGVQNIDASAGTFSGVTTGGGTWSGMFHGVAGVDNALPGAVSGTFDGHFPNGHVLGAFGANCTDCE